MRPIAFLLALACCAACSDANAPRSVLLITIDTLRADHLGVYGAEATAAGSPTPHIDRFAAEPTLFERAMAPMPLTRPSHFSILTSLYPREHGVVNNAMALPNSEVTLPEMLREEGFRTGAFVGVRLLDETSGAQQGFETYSAPKTTTRSAEEVVGETLTWLDTLGADESFFLWVHVFDPHLPYAPPADLRTGLDPDLEREYPAMDWAELYEVAERHSGDIPGNYFEHAKALYQGDVTYTDRWIGKLFEGLGPRLDDTLTLLTADHGESFGNGVYFEHADCLYEGAIRIPLIVRYPPLFQAGVRRQQLTSNLDVAPTVLEALGLDIPVTFSGHSLLDTEGDEDRFVILQHPLFQPRAAKNRPEKRRRMISVAGAPTSEVRVDAERVGVMSSRWKLLRMADERELYPTGPNADETQNLVESEPDELERMERLLEETLARHPLRIIDQEEIGEDMLDQLKELGYIE